MRFEFESVIGGAMPVSFSFYELGEVVAAQDSKNITFESPVGVAFSLHSTELPPNTILMLVVDGASDLSLFSEMGNIFASKLATSLAQHAANLRDVIVSPPHLLSQKRLKQMLKMKYRRVERFYQYRRGDQIAPVQIVILSTQTEKEMSDV